MTDFEIVKLFVSAATPIAVGSIAFIVNGRLKKFEHTQWTNQKLISKKLEVYEDLIPKLNDVLCYFTYIGSWKNFEPKEIINLKRDCDKIAYVYAPLFPKDFLNKYNDFMNSCFSSYSGWGNDAKLRTEIKRRKESNKDWINSWDDFFAIDNEVSNPSAIRELYIAFVQFFAKEISVGMNFESVDIGDLPKSIR